MNREQRDASDRSEQAESRKLRPYTDGKLKAKKGKLQAELSKELGRPALNLAIAILNPQERKTFRKMLNIDGKRGRPEDDDEILLRKMSVLKRAQPDLSIRDVAKRILGALPSPERGGLERDQVEFYGRIKSRESLLKTLISKYERHECDLMHCLNQEEAGAAMLRKILPATSEAVDEIWKNCRPCATTDQAANKLKIGYWKWKQAGGRTSIGVDEHKLDGYCQALRSHWLKRANKAGY